MNAKEMDKKLKELKADYRAARANFNIAYANYSVCNNIYAAGKYDGNAAADSRTAATAAYRVTEAAWGAYTNELLVKSVNRQIK